MKRAALFFGALCAIALPVGTVDAHDDEYDCPGGTDAFYKVEPLDGYTFVVPTPPAGWTINAVILKVGGPGGGTHILFSPVTPGQVLDVSNQQYEISHAHVCKDRVQETTTSTTSTSTTTSTTSTAPSTTTQPTTTSTDPATTSTSTTTTTPVTSSTAPSSTSTTVPVTSTTAPETTSTSSPTTSTAPSTTLAATTTVTVAATNPASTALTTTTVAPKIPVTGSGDGLLAVWAAAILGLGSAAVFAARRRV